MVIIRNTKLAISVAFCVVFMGVCILLLAQPMIRLQFMNTFNAPRCGDNVQEHEGLAKSDSSLLQKLSEYETVCHSTVTDTMMIFVAMPTTAGEAQQTAHDTVATLREFASHGIRPLVSFEPSLASHTIITDIKKGIYDSVLTDFFNTLKSEGVTDTQMGTWVLLPEANTPTWYDTSPVDFTANVIKVATIQKQIFPKSKTTILLNSRTYSANDRSWDHGQLTSLVPYVENIPEGVVDSFGYQGFPSVSAANANPTDKYSQLTASSFLPSNLAIEAARALHTQKVWLNTGAFHRTYTDQPAQQVELSMSQRQNVLSSIVDAAKQIKASNDAVSVNLFAADKSSTSEHTDWSYWPSGKADTSPDTVTFTTFVSQLRAEGIGFSLYDD